jgi:hypothetical protein
VVEGADDTYWREARRRRGFDDAPSAAAATTTNNDRLISSVACEQTTVRCIPPQLSVAESRRRASDIRAFDFDDLGHYGTVSVAELLLTLE